jgi:formylglycine-generating enzyme required for sulfatase activity
VALQEDGCELSAALGGRARVRDEGRDNKALFLWQGRKVALPIRDVFDQTAKRSIKGPETWAIADCDDGYAYTAPVGHFAANPFRIHDVHGNVWDWTEDCWNADYEGAPTDGSAWTSGDCSKRVVRGGSLNGNPPLLRSAFRSGSLGDTGSTTS